MEVCFALPRDLTRLHWFSEGSRRCLCRRRLLVFHLLFRVVVLYELEILLKIISIENRFNAHPTDLNGNTAQNLLSGVYVLPSFSASACTFHISCLVRIIGGHYQ